MSMIGWVLALSPRQIDALRAAPTLAKNVVMLAEHEYRTARRAIVMSRLPPEQREAAAARASASMETPERKAWERERIEAQAKLVGMGPFQQALDLEKSWHLLHYVLSGNVGPSRAPGDALLTGEELGDDVGYGPARLHDAVGTQAFAHFLHALDTNRLQERINYREMSRVGVYSMPLGSATDSEYERELRDELAAYFPLLRDYVIAAANAQSGLLTWIS
jgi:hypothetical protein